MRAGARGRGLAAALILVAAAAVLANLPALESGFVFDDSEVIVKNPRVTSPELLGSIWTTPYWGSRATGGLYRPLTTVTYALQHRLWGLDPRPYHALNLALHAAVSLLLLLAALEFVSLPAAFALALLFAVHPVHTEAVVNTVGQAELLAALGFWLAWLAHPARPEGGGLSAAASRPRAAGLWGRRLLAALFYGAAILSKEAAVVLPAALLVRDLAGRRRLDPVVYVLYALVLGGCLALRLHVLGALGNPPGLTIYRVDNVIATLPFLPGLWTALAVFGRYLRLLVFPDRLSADYSWPAIEAAAPGDLWAWTGLLGVVLLTALFVMLCVRLRGRVSLAGAAGRTGMRAALVGLGVFGLTFLPVSNFVLRIGTVMGERLLYLPSAGLLLAVGGLWDRLHFSAGFAGRRLLYTATALLVLAGAARSVSRSRDWRSDLTLSERTIEDEPKSSRGRFNHGVAMHDLGRDEEAVAEMRRTVTLDSTYIEAWVNLGGYLFGMGKSGEARAALGRAIAVDSTWYSGPMSLGAIELTEGRPEQALEHLELARRHGDDDATVHFNLALARTALGDTARALAEYRRAVALNPGDPDSRNNLAWLLVAAHRDLDEALGHAEAAVKLKPSGSTWDTLAEVRLARGEKAAARAAWEKALGFPDVDAAEVRRQLHDLGAGR